MTSRRLALLRAALRYIVKPILGAVLRPDSAARGVRRMTRTFVRPPRDARQVTLTGPGGPIPALRLDPAGGPPEGRPVVLWFHGGGYVVGGRETHAGLLRRLVDLSGLSMILVDYRLAGDAPLPAAYEDALAAATAAVRPEVAPGGLILGGDSAGGGLALAVLSTLTRTGAPLRAAVVYSPWTDLTLGGRSLEDNAEADPLLPSAQAAALRDVVAAGADPRDPRLSPLFAEFRDPPPVLIQVGAEEILLDDSRRMAARLRAAGGDVTLEIWEGVPHSWQLLAPYLPEAEEALEATARFLGRVTAGDRQGES